MGELSGLPRVNSVFDAMQLPLMYFPLLLSPSAGQQLVTLGYRSVHYVTVDYLNYFDSFLFLYIINGNQ